MTSACSNMLTSTAAKRQRPAFDQLATFLTVAETGSFSAAARLTGRTQPAISQAIARLEDIYGGDLFERRRGAPLALTPIGEAILPSAQILLKTIDEQMGTAAEAASGEIGAVVVGVDPDIATGRHRGGLVAFAMANPAARLRTIEAPSAGRGAALGDRRLLSLCLMGVAAHPGGATAHVRGPIPRADTAARGPTDRRRRHAGRIAAGDPCARLRAVVG